MRVAIIGLGLIGGSWGLALREWSRSEEGKNSKLEIVGFDAKATQRNEAQKQGVCDRTTLTPMEAVVGAEVVIVATPPLVMRETFEDIAAHLSRGAIVTDTASTKREVLRWAKELLPDTISFIGGHPMAGKTASLEGATATLFNKCTYCLIPLPNAQAGAIEALTRLVEIVGGRPHFIDPAEHDSYVAAISHLPFLMSVALTNLTSESEGWREISKLAAGGYQDMTRLSGGSVTMHLDICRTNSDAILDWLDRYQQTLTDLRAVIEKAGLYDEEGRPRPSAETDPVLLQDYIERAHKARERWEEERARPPQIEGLEQINLPTKKELQAEYTRMFTGSWLKRRTPDNGKK
ncbi:MAG: prephenate dehydrogenase [Chloroflexota bacterium]|nr:prephenate dehydrogenase [Chloroflexota bacterium]